MSPVGLENLIASLPQSQDPNLLVGYATSDDAGVYRIAPDLALVSTVDMITAPVDDPFIFGQIAAANSLSDIYAMGGRPIMCLNIAAFPPKDLAPEVLFKIIEGALTKIVESGAVLAGGHTVEDEEPKYGLVVNGLVHPEKYWSNAGAKPGDVLILTKPVGSGVLFNANLKSLVSESDMNACIDYLTTLNKTAAETFSNFSVHAATDITGFGLAGHAYEMAKASGATLIIDMEHLPIMNGALEMYQKGVGTGMNRPNRNLLRNRFRFECELPKWHQEIVFDPQTSGGLLWSGPAEQADPLLADLHSAGITKAAVIGTVQAREDNAHVIFR